MQANPITLLVWGAFAAYTVFHIVQAVRLYGRVRASEFWPETVGEIKSAGTNYSSSEDGKKFWADFTYSYSVVGAVYYGKFRIERAFGFGSGEGTAKKHVAEHPVGSTITVRFNPENPEETVTEYDRMTIPGLIGP